MVDDVADITSTVPFKNITGTNIDGIIADSPQLQALMKSVGIIAKQDMPPELKLVQLMNMTNQKTKDDRDNVISDQVSTLAKMIKSTAAEILPKLIDKPKFMNPVSERDYNRANGIKEDSGGLIETFFPDAAKSIQDFEGETSGAATDFISSVLGLGA